MTMNRKTATKLLIVQWARFQNLCINLKGSTLLTGVNGSGKSTILDAVTYLLTGNTQFNKAAKDRDRTVLGYVRGDTKSNGPFRYLREGEVISYIAMEFWSPVENSFLVVGVCIESADHVSKPKSGWFVCRNAKIEQMNFARKEDRFLWVAPRNQLAVNGRALKSADFLGRDRGVEQIMRALGLRCDAAKYRIKLIKMMAFNPENNIDQFIQECVLEPGKVESLHELREQRARFDEIKQIYENLRDSKTQLNEVERKITEYEIRQRALRIRELMLCYQDLRESEEKKKEIQLKRTMLIQKQNNLEKQKEELDIRCHGAGERYRIALNNDAFQGMQETLNHLNRQSESLEEKIRQSEERIAKLKKLQISLTELLKWIEEFFTFSKEEKESLCHLAEQGASAEKVIHAFARLGEMVGAQEKIFEKDEVHLGDTIGQLNHEIGELECKIERLKSNIMVFPREIELAKQTIQKELETQGAHTEVKIFAELVQEILDVKWRGAIETFLGRKRFYIIVEGKFCHQAMEILQRKKLFAANIVLSDKLPDTSPAPGSGAEILKIPNIYARRYANYLLNGIYLCDTLEELHAHPRGGLMRDGMLAKSYAVSYMNVDKTESCLGQDAMKLQLLKAKQDKADKSRQREALKKKMEQICGKRRELKRIDWNVENYDFGAVSAWTNAREEKNRIRVDMERISQNPDFMAVLEEQENARREYEKLENAKELLLEEIGGCKKHLETCEEELKNLAGEIFVREREYSEKRMMHIELERPMLEEYEKLRAKKGGWQAVSPKSVRNLQREVEECVRQMESAQLNYCKLAEIEIYKRGVAYIPFFREERRNIANIKIEEARQRLEEQSLKLENAFMNDFVAEMNETIRDAKEEIGVINRELKALPFGNDTYKFVMKERPDRDIFFRICKKLENYMGLSEVYMNSAREDEEMERDIQQFMEVILEEEDETEYTDYRKYFVYDMEIASRQGKNEVISDLSKKQGSASNGEKQTPYFIILAASLLQCYPRQVCCARLAFIDEAFSALSRERIEQMVKYLEDNCFQVFYAAPPEKISSIGAFIESTVSLVTTGRHTDAVEGLVK